MPDFNPDELAHILTSLKQQHPNKQQPPDQQQPQQLQDGLEHYLGSMQHQPDPQEPRAKQQKKQLEHQQQQPQPDQQPHMQQPEQQQQVQQQDAADSTWKWLAVEIRLLVILALVNAKHHCLPVPEIYK